MQDRNREDMWSDYFTHLRSCNVFECINNKNVLEIATANGRFWKLYKEYNPKSITGLDPDDRWNLVDGVNKSDIINECYTSYLPNKSYDVIICFGLLYKLHSPFNLLELLANSDPEYIILEDLLTDLIKDKFTYENDLSLGNKGDLIVNQEKHSKFFVWFPRKLVIAAMENMQYKLVKEFYHTTKYEGSKKDTHQYIFKKVEE